MASGIDIDALVRPLGDDAPCGVSLEDTQQMAAIDAFRIFGQAAPLKSDTDWRAIKDASREALNVSHDLRLLAHLAAASLRVDGLPGFVACLGVASRWLTDQFDQVYPRVDDDAMLRKNAVNCFADPMAVVDQVRRVPIVSDRQVGTFSLRHVEIATGKIQATAEDGSSPPTEALISAAFSATDQATLVQQVATIAEGLAALKAIEVVMVAKHGVQAAPDTGPLAAVLTRMRELTAKHVRAPAPDVGEGSAEEGGAASGVPGQIRNRDDAVRSLEAVADFFRRSEPSSPVPMFVDRAKRLVAADFLEVLSELAPDAVAGVKKVGGIREEAKK